MSPSSETGLEPGVAERIVRLPVDLHARPAGKFSQLAARYSSEVTVGVGDRAVDARSVLMVMALGATAGTEVTIRARGEDAGGAVRDLGDLLASIAE
ncbi:MAG TPA: HPr family phosphocarrier protein [Actinomycetota bacterium]